jgi:hypothetical protein
MLLRQAGQPFPGIIDFGKTGIRVLPEGQELAISFARLILSVLALSDQPE